jgi:hypothetical protein
MDMDDNNKVRVTRQCPTVQLKPNLFKVLCGLRISPYIENNYALAFSHRADTSSIVQRTFQYNILPHTLQDRGP